MHAFPSGKKRMIMVTFFSYAKPLSFPSKEGPLPSGPSSFVVSFKVPRSLPLLVFFSVKGYALLLKEETPRKEKHGKEKKGDNQVTMRRRLRIKDTTKEVCEGKDKGFA